ncbi:hypothetical protein ZWY2020_033211 [Hordeum vulgare]|nr:hypothetical protein ZWY2020_033211 [Hordeum vulgare]
MGKLLVIVAIKFFVSNEVRGTPQTTCKEAVDIDQRINYEYCVSQLLVHHESTIADTWGLAKITALMGAKNVIHTKAYDDTILGKPGCKKLYNRTFMSFIVAHEDLKVRKYSACKHKVAESIKLVHQCDEAFEKAEIESKLTKQNAHSVQVAIISTGITNLITLENLVYCTASRVQLNKVHDSLCNFSDYLHGHIVCGWDECVGYF